MRKFTLFLAALLISMTAFSAKLYLTPNANWKQSNARFAAYFFGNGEMWISMTKVAGETDLYEVEAPAGYPNVIFCRMNPSASANNWDNKWNQTSDLQVPTNAQNHYTVKEGTWDKGGGTWTVYAPEAPKTYKDITITITANAQPKIHYWEGGDKMVGSAFESMPNMVATAEANTYSYTIKDVDAALGVKYLIVVGDVQSVDLHTIDNVTANFKECLPQVVVMGVNNWDGTDKMVVADDYKTASITLNLTAKTYAWKLTVNSEWFGGSTYTITREKNSIEMKDNGDGDGKLTADLAGEYVFTYTYATKNLTVTYPVVKPAITATWSMAEGAEVETFSEATITFTGVDAVKAQNSYGCSWFYEKGAEGDWQLVSNVCTAGYMDAAATGTSFTLSVDPACYSKDMKSPFSVKGEYRIVIPVGGIYFNGDKTNLNTEEYVLNFVIDNDFVELQEIDAAYTVNPENNTTVSEIREIILTFPEYETITVAELDLVMGSNIPAFMKKDDLTGAMMPVGYIFFEAMADQANAIRLYVPEEFMGMDAIKIFGEYQIVIPAGVVTFGTAGTSKEIVLNYTIGEVEELPMEVEFENIAAIYEMGMWDMAYYESYSDYEVVALLKSQPTVVDKVVTSGMMGGSMNNYYLNDGTGVIVLQTEGDIINPIMDENYENIIGYDTIPGLTIEVGKKLPVDFMANIDFKTVTDDETWLPTGEVYGAPVMMFVPKVTGVDEEGWKITESNEDFVARCEASDFVEETVEVSIDSLLANRMDYAGKLVVVDTTANYYAAAEMNYMTGGVNTTAYMYWDAEEAFEVETWEEEETTYVFVSPKMTEDWNNYAGKLFNVKAENLPEAALDANVTIDVVKARFDWNSIAQGQSMIAKEYGIVTPDPVDVENNELVVNIYSNNGSVYVETEAGSMIEVYTVNGLRVYAGVSNTNTTVINGLSNIAIIRVNGEAYKVFVK